MRKDIEIPEVKGVSVGITKETAEDGESRWNVYLINQKDEPIESVLVSSTGYGEAKGEKTKTSTLRHFFEVIPAKSYVLIEPIMEELFGLTNEYWVSFYIDRTIFDKKFIFLPESIQLSNTTSIPVLHKAGILIG
ncbi:MAG: hypothetical protein V4616_01925 [Bacteroidota bacterium]